MTDNQAWKIADVAFGLYKLCSYGILPGIEIHSKIEQLLSVSKHVRLYFLDMLHNRPETKGVKEYYEYWFGELNS